MKNEVLRTGFKHTVQQKSLRQKVKIMQWTDKNSIELPVICQTAMEGCQQLQFHFHKK